MLAEVWFSSHFWWGGRLKNIQPYHLIGLNVDVALKVVNFLDKALFDFLFHKIKVGLLLTD